MDQEVCQAENQGGVAGRRDRRPFETSSVKGLVHSFGSGVSPFSRRRRAIAHGNPLRSNSALRFDSEVISYFVLRNTRNPIWQLVSRTYPTVKNAPYHTTLPLYNQASPDVVMFSKIPSQQRSRHILDRVEGRARSTKRRASSQEEHVCGDTERRWRSRGRWRMENGEWRMECGFEPGAGKRQVEYDFESGEWFRSVNLPPVGNLSAGFCTARSRSAPCDVRYLEPFTDVPGKSGFPVAILQE